MLGILLTEVDAVRGNDVKQLEADRGDAAKMAGTERTLEDATQRLDVNPRVEPVRIQLGLGWREEQIDPRALGDLPVVCLIAWVALEIGLFAELRRVDEQADDNRVAFAASSLEKRDMARVKRAHCWHQTNAPPTLRCERRAGLSNRSRNLHLYPMRPCAYAPMRPRVPIRLAPGPSSSADYTDYALRPAVIRG